MLSLILKITIAHLLGDFVFQTNKMVEDINVNKLKSKGLLIHFGIHLFLLFIVTAFKKEFILPVILLAIAHLGIDFLTKIAFRNQLNSILRLVIDQLMHFITIAAFVYYFFPFEIKYEGIFNTTNYVLLISIICTTSVSGIVVKKIMEVLNYDIQNQGIKDAGKYIGILERLFVFLFVVTDFWQGIGFLLAAKSIFRFGDLKDDNDVKLTEYILIGTLISFGLAILIGKFYLKIKIMI